MGSEHAYTFSGKGPGGLLLCWQHIRVLGGGGGTVVIEAVVYP